MDELIPTLDKLIGKELQKAEREQHHQALLHALTQKLDRLEERKNKTILKVIELVKKKKYQKAKELIMSKGKKGSPLVIIIIIVILLMVILGYFLLRGRLQLF